MWLSHYARQPSFLSIPLTGGRSSLLFALEALDRLPLCHESLPVLYQNHIWTTGQLLTIDQVQRAWSCWQVSQSPTPSRLGWHLTFLLRHLLHFRARVSVSTVPSRKIERAYCQLHALCCRSKIAAIIEHWAVSTVAETSLIGHK